MSNQMIDAHVRYCTKYYVQLYQSTLTVTHNTTWTWTWYPESAVAVLTSIQLLYNCSALSCSSLSSLAEQLKPA